MLLFLFRYFLIELTGILVSRTTEYLIQIDFRALM